MLNKKRKPPKLCTQLRRFPLPPRSNLVAKLFLIIFVLFFYSCVWGWCLNLPNHSSTLPRGRFSQPNPELTYMASSPCSPLALGIRSLTSKAGITGSCLSYPLDVIPAFWGTELWSSQSVKHRASHHPASFSHCPIQSFPWGLLMIMRVLSNYWKAPPCFTY